MSFSYVRYVADGNTDEFDLTFPYLRREHVSIKVNGIVPVLPVRWVGDSRVKINANIASGSIVELRRETPISSSLVDFQNGSVLTEEELDTAQLQLLYIQQELKDLYDDALEGRLFDAISGTGITGDDLLDQLAAWLIQNETALALQQSLDDIAAQGASLAEVALNASTNAADIITEREARIDGDAAVATNFDALIARIEAAEAVVATEATARADGDTALAQSITNLTTSVGNNTSSITTLQQSINGVSARYGVALDVNGFITGFEQLNDGQTGSFNIMADRFAIVDPNGGAGQTPFTPFEIINGTTFIREAAIDRLSVNKLTAGILNAGVTQNADWTVGTGRIIWSNGSFMRVSGVGFGTSNQFIDWFGPARPINTCNEASAIFYLKTNGSAYFGGALTAGVLRNAAQTTQTSANASVSTGSFGSNGGTRVVVVSINAFRKTDISGSCNGSGTSSYQIRLRRNGSILNTWTVFGSTSCTPGFSQLEPGTWEDTVNGSFTFTDNSGGSSAEYTAEIVSRSQASVPSSAFGAFTFTQSLSVVSTEE